MAKATSIPLTNLIGEKGFRWDITQPGPQAVNTPNENATKKLYKNLVKHVEKYPEELDYCAIDISGTMFDDKATHEERVAHHLDEALALSEALLDEIKKRENGDSSTGKKLILIVNQWDQLFTIHNIDQAGIYMDLWTNLKIALQAGAYGIHMLMQIQSPEKETPEAHRLVLTA